MFELLASRRAMVLVLSIGLLIAGAVSVRTMPRQEDPPAPDFRGVVTMQMPGAEPETLERLVVQRTEDELAAVDGILHIDALIRPGVAYLLLELRYATGDEATVWAEVDRALRRVRQDYPPSALEPQLVHDLWPTEAIVVALGGSGDRRVLARHARRLERALLRLPEVARVVLAPDAHEEIDIALSPAAARRHRLSPAALAAQLHLRNTAGAGGVVEADGSTVAVRPDTELSSLASIARTPIQLPGGETIPLGELAEVRSTISRDAGIVRFNGGAAVIAGIVPRDGIHAGDFGAAVRGVLADAALPESLRIDEIVYQPDYVQQRLGGLLASLVIGVLLVAGILFAFMGPRVGLVVAAVLPVVLMGTIAMYDAGGGILHQISLAALVIALGMLVDNAIVIADGIQRQIDAGVPAPRASISVARAVAVPLAAATATTVATFLPMLLADGKTADFTTSIPVVVALSLALSYGVSLVVTPVLAAAILRPRPRAAARRRPRASRLAALAVRRPAAVVVATLLLCVACGLLATRLDITFFPRAARPQLVLHVELDQGASLEAVDAATARIEAAVARRDEVASIASFVGRRAAKFYYNQPLPMAVSNRAEIIVTTTTPAAADALQAWVQDELAPAHPHVRLATRGISQGTPARAPLSVRIYGEDLVSLQHAAHQIRAVLREVPGAVAVGDTVGKGMATVRFRADDAALARHGVSRQDVASALYGHTAGTLVGHLRRDDDLVPIRVTSEEREDTPVDALDGIEVPRPRAEPVAIAQVARPELRWRPASIERHDGRRVAYVDAELAPDASAIGLALAATPALETLDLPAGTSWEMSGLVNEWRDATGELLAAMPIGGFVLVLVLLAMFASVRAVAIILVTIPLSCAGVVPGLLLGGQPFDFMAILGVLALSGVVVNNAIVLLDVIEKLRGQGATLQQALVDAVARRARPILLTSATTVAGLLPLAVSDAPLWPPLAWAMISGLVMSTGLSLLVVPALYKLMMRRAWRTPSTTPAVAVARRGAPR